MTQMDHSPIRILAMYLNPLALPHEHPARDATARERRRVHIDNLLRLRPLMRDYIDRSAHITLGLFIGFTLFTSLLPLKWLATACGVGIFLALLHTVFLIFLQQRANDLANAAGKANPEIEKTTEREK